jgi:hypothetical protein
MEWHTCIQRTKRMQAVRSRNFQFVFAIWATKCFHSFTHEKHLNCCIATTSIAYGELSCFTCHSNIHTTYSGTDFFPLTTTAAVPMTMWKGTKTINLTQDNSFSNLCIKCHQPRPMTTSSTISNGDVVDYASLVSNPTAVFMITLLVMLHQ